VISKNLPGFCFVEPTNRETINIGFASVNVTAETRRIRAIWTPEMAQDLQGFQNIDAEAELTALLTENLRNEIDQQILRDLHDNQRFYNQNTQRDIFNRWNQIGGNILINHHGADIVGNRAPQDNQPPDFGHIALPIARRVAAQTIGLDLVGVQPLTPPDLNLLYQDYTALPNEEGWFTDGTFDSLLIKMEMQPFRFILPRHLRNRRARRRTDWRNFSQL